MNRTPSQILQANSESDQEYASRDQTMLLLNMRSAIATKAVSADSGNLRENIVLEMKSGRIIPFSSSLKIFQIRDPIHQEARQDD